MRMVSLNDDSLPSWRLGTPHDSLNRFASLLGKFVLKKDDENEESFIKEALAPNHVGLLKLVSNKAIGKAQFSFPCLSLVTEDHVTEDGLEQSQIQQKAALSMARILIATKKSAGRTPGESRSISDAADWCHSATATLTLDSVPSAMLENLAASFALLVDARLRAYTIILARHGASLAAATQVEQEAIAAVARKLESLAEIGSRISIDNMVTSFTPQFKHTMSRSVDKGSVDEIMIPLVMSAVLDISVPNESDGHERMTIPLQAAGAIVGTFLCSSDKGSKLLKAVRLELDTQQLMSAMVHKAAKVSSVALEHVNDSTCRHVAAAMLTLKTALPDKPPPQSSSDQQQRILPVVSPDQIAILPLKRPTPLTLDDKEAEGEGHELTPECCASIVDDCIGGIGKDSLMLSPPTKKIRLEDSPAVPPAVL